MNGIIQKYHVSKNLLNIGLFATTYTGYCTYTDDTLTITGVTTTMSNNGISVDIPANTVFTVEPLEVENGIVNARFKFEGNDGSQMIYLYDANGEPNTISPISFNFAINKITFLWSNASGKTASFRFFMINRGSRALPYEPFETDNLFNEVYPSITSSAQYIPLSVGDGDYTLSTTTPQAQSAALLFLLAGNVSSGVSTATNGVWNGQTRTVTAVNGYVTIAYRAYPEASPVNYKTILNKGQSAKPYTPYGTVWKDIPYSQLETATDVVTSLPVKVYGDGETDISLLLKGNTETSGNPSPLDPITIDGVGNKTPNLLNYKEITTTPNYATVTLITNGVNLTGKYMATIDISLEVGSTYKMSWLQEVVSGTADTGWRYKYTDNTYSNYGGNGGGITVEKDVSQVLLYVTKSNDTASVNYTNIMLSKGSTSLPYEPYGYKISILKDLQALTPVYLSEPLMKIGDIEDTLNSDGTVTRRIGKIDLGTLNWHLSASYNGICDSTVPNMRIIDNMTTGNAICTSFIEVDANSVGSTSYGFSSCLNLLAKPYINHTGFEGYTDEQFIEALSGVIMYYVLATPTTETVTVPTITTTGGEVTLDVDTTVKPSELDLTYHGWHEHEPEKYIDPNLSPLTEFTNTTTDSRQFIRARILTKLNNVEQEYISLSDISATGTISYTVNITKDNDILSFLHSGADRNISIFNISGGVPQGTYTLSFNVQGYDCSTVGGVVLSNIEFRDANGGNWE